ALLHAPRVAVAIAGFALTGWISALVVNASAQRATLLLKLRQLVLTAPLWTWLLGVVGAGGGLGALAWFGLLRNVAGVIGLAVLAAIAFFLLVDRKLTRQRRPALDAVEQMLKGMRLRGLEELALRQFVCKYSGQDWEPLYEALFGYEAKLHARTKWGRDEKNLPRKRRGAWRDPLIRWINHRLERRQHAKDELHLASLEQTRTSGS
ncbi:MAG: serine/threonine protein kinase, partial [Myxococcaceae bacterium]|nr:serine/threonine protein kinase [Myxococcaceae bacterium]